MFSYALHQLHVITSSFDQFFLLPVAFIIDWSDYFIIGFTTLNRKLLFTQVANSQLTWLCLTKQLALVTSSQMYNKYQKSCLMHTDFTTLHVSYMHLFHSCPVHWGQCLCPLSLANMTAKLTTLVLFFLNICC